MSKEKLMTNQILFNFLSVRVLPRKKKTYKNIEYAPFFSKVSKEF